MVGNQALRFSAATEQTKREMCAMAVLLQADFAFNGPFADEMASSLQELAQAINQERAFIPVTRSPLVYSGSQWQQWR